MNQIRLIAKAASNPIDCRGLTPQALHGQSEPAILALNLSSGGRVGDAFDVVITQTDDTLPRLMFEHTTAQHHAIGLEMAQGEIMVTHAAGDFLGAGMQGGVIICRGNAGDRLADRMRRGLCLVEGSVGAYAGANLLAGTLGILGQTGDYLGYGMKRGTLLLGAEPSPQATWVDCGQHTLPFLSLLYQSFRGLDSQFAHLSNQRVQRWMGDMGGLGKAEMLWLLPNA